MLKKMLEEKTELRKYLFDKGFLITDNKSINTDMFPFYGNYQSKEVGTFVFYVHNRNKVFFFEKSNQTFFLIGHALNPYSLEYEEHKILERIANSYFDGKFYDAVDELTGVFILGVVDGKNIEFLLDASGMQYGVYGKINDNVYISSHMRMVGDFLPIETDPFVVKLTSYKWYHYMMGNYLPGDITCYSEMKRIIPNTSVKYDGCNFEINRFYPKKEIKMCEREDEYRSVIEQGAEVLKNTMSLIAKKWDRCAISLTGGVDSNTTFAAANGEYDRFTSFSYISMGRESIDAEKAEEISKRFNVSHTNYVIPESNGDVENFDEFKRIFVHNDGDIGREKDNEARKKATLIKEDVCDVEIKSWISETIRAYAYKYFGKKKFPKKLKPRHYTSLYKLFFLKRGLVAKTDSLFKEYIEKTQLKEHLFNYDETDFFVWEMMHGGKCGLNIGVMKSCFDIAIPYNNRKWLDLLLRVPLDKRISDTHHMDMKKYLNEELYDMNIRVVNQNETKTRKRFLGAYFTINTHLPF